MGLFNIRFRPGIPPYEQVLFAVKKAIVRGQLMAGERFPSVRALSQELRINPNTAHKVVAALVSEGLIEVLPGVGTVVASAPAAGREQRRGLLGDEVERLVVEARTLGLDLDDVLSAVRSHWNRLGKGKP